MGKGHEHHHGHDHAHGDHAHGDHAHAHEHEHAGDHGHGHSHGPEHAHSGDHGHSHGDDDHPMRAPLTEGAGAGKVLFFDAFSGTAGDMTIAALLDLGVPLLVIERAVAALPLDGFHL